MTSRKIINSKLKEAVDSVLPITLIVAVLCFFFVPVGSGLMLAFLVGAVMLILGMGLFTLGAELSMTQMGNLVGAKMTKSRRLWLILVLAFVLGVVITIAEPDLQVLAQNVPGIDKTMLILTVSVGVGIFLTICMLRILLGISLRTLLLIFYAIVFILAALSDPDFLSVAFDSGGVTTGPMTVPFIMALGVGVASIRSDEKAKSDSFGLVALCSIGPILAVLLLGFLYPENTASASETVVNSFENTLTVGYSYLEELPAMMGEVAIALLPICVFFLLFQIFSLHLRKLPLLRILIGVGYTYVGLVLFLTGVNVGFSSLGYVLGGVIVEEGLGLLMIPLATLMGWFIINAEPAVHVLNKQVEEITAGAIPAHAMNMALSVGVALSLGLAMIRVLTGISIMWFLIPGYAISLTLSFVVPHIFTSVAFDSGGVASGPMTATFMLQFMIGASTVVGGNPLIDAFGVVAMVAMMPLISIQMVGFIYSRRTEPEIAREQYGDDEIIELWEVNAA